MAFSLPPNSHPPLLHFLFSSTIILSLLYSLKSEKLWYQTENVCIVLLPNHITLHQKEVRKVVTWANYNSRDVVMIAISDIPTASLIGFYCCQLQYYQRLIRYTKANINLNDEHLFFLAASPRYCHFLSHFLQTFFLPSIPRTVLFKLPHIEFTWVAL